MARASRPAGPPTAPTPEPCRCAGGRGRTTATFRDQQLVAVVREHRGRCRLGDEPLDIRAWLGGRL